MGQPRKKKKRKKKRYLLKFTISAALITGAYFFLNSELFDIQKIVVENNSYYTSEQIIEIAGAKTGANLFHAETSGLKDKLLADPYIKSAKVSRRIPDKLVISIEERKEFAAVAIENCEITKEVPVTVTPQGITAPDPLGGAAGGTPGAVNGEPESLTPAAAGTSGEAVGISGGSVNADGGQAPAGNGTVQYVSTTVIGTLYAILDQDGMVLRTTDVIPGLPVMYGLSVSSAKPGKPLKVEENLMFTETLAMIESMNDNELFFKKIVVTPVLVKAYVYDSLVCEGTPENFRHEMKGLKVMLGELYKEGIERGVLRVIGDNSFPYSPIIEE